jgi:hypothetical protein
VLVKAVRELAEPEGSNLRAVEKFLQTVYEIEVEQVRACTVLYIEKIQIAVLRIRIHTKLSWIRNTISESAPS